MHKKLEQEVKVTAAMVKKVVENESLSKLEMQPEYNREQLLATYVQDAHERTMDGDTAPEMWEFLESLLFFDQVTLKQEDVDYMLWLVYTEETIQDIKDSWTRNESYGGQ